MRKRGLFGIVILLSCLFAWTACARGEAPYPVSFDLRNVNGENYVTPVREQAPYATCWAHAAMASMESIHLRRTGVTLDLSEMHLAYFAYKGPYGYTPRSGEFPAILDNGGSFAKAMAMLGGWRGAVLEADLPYSGSAEPAGTVSGYPNRLRLRDVLFVDDELGPQAAEDMRKELIMTHGAIATVFDAGDFNLNQTTAAWYNHTDLSPEDDPDTTDRYHPDHAVAIVGWDDGYSRENFNEAMRPERDGAWLIKNSWGETLGNDGYFWVSYDDESLADGVAFIPEEASGYDNLYDYDALGWCVQIGPGDGSPVWMANVFTARGEEELRAISFYTTEADTAYEIAVRTPAEGGGPSSGALVSAQSGTQTFAGYHTVDLETPVSLAPGTRFSVAVRLAASDGEPIAVERRLAGFSDNASANPGESFVSVDGAEWDDLGDGPEGERANVCLKAFTVNVSAPAPTPSNGGGCDAGAGARNMLAFAALLMSARRIRKIFTLKASNDK